MSLYVLTCALCGWTSAPVDAWQSGPLAEGHRLEHGLDAVPTSGAEDPIRALAPTAVDSAP